MALFAEQVPEGDREGFVGVVVKADVGGALGEGVVQFETVCPRLGKAGQVAFYVGQEYRARPWARNPSAMI